MEKTETWISQAHDIAQQKEEIVKQEIYSILISKNILLLYIENTLKHKLNTKEANDLIEQYKNLGPEQAAEIALLQPELKENPKLGTLLEQTSKIAENKGKELELALKKIMVVMDILSLFVENRLNRKLDFDEQNVLIKQYKNLGPKQAEEISLYRHSTTKKPVKNMKKRKHKK